MPTVSINLDTTQYVQVNSNFNPLILQSFRDAVNITLSDSKPLLSNSVFHVLSGSDTSLKIDGPDTNVWALATSDSASLIVSQINPDPVHVRDVHYKIINHHIHQPTAVSSTLSANSAANDYQITLNSVVGFAAEDRIEIDELALESTHPKIKAINGNTLTLDRRLDFPHLISTVVVKVINDMTSASGSIASPQIYKGGPTPGNVWHITRMLFSMIHGTAGDLGLFGNLSELSNGVLLRAKINGQYGTLTNWKTNADIKTDMYDVSFDARSGGQGSYGTSGRGTFKETGAILRLDGDTNDVFEVHIQDDITAMGYFEMKIQGHTEGI